MYRNPQGLWGLLETHKTLRGLQQECYLLQAERACKYEHKQDFKVCHNQQSC